MKFHSIKQVVRKVESERERAQKRRVGKKQPIEEQPPQPKAVATASPGNSSSSEIKPTVDLIVEYEGEFIVKPLNATQDVRQMSLRILTLNSSLGVDRLFVLLLPSVPPEADSVRDAR